MHGSKEIPQSLLVAPQGDSDDDEEDQGMNIIILFFIVNKYSFFIILVICLFNFPSSFLVEGQSEVGQTTEQLASLDVKDGQGSV